MAPRVHSRLVTCTLESAVPRKEQAELCTGKVRRHDTVQLKTTGHRAAWEDDLFMKNPQRHTHVGTHVHVQMYHVGREGTGCVSGQSTTGVFLSTPVFIGIFI